MTDRSSSDSARNRYTLGYRRWQFARV